MQKFILNMKLGIYRNEGFIELRYKNDKKLPAKEVQKYENLQK